MTSNEATDLFRYGDSTPATAADETKKLMADVKSALEQNPGALDRICDIKFSDTGESVAFSDRSQAAVCEHSFSHPAEADTWGGPSPEPSNNPFSN